MMKSIRFSTQRLIAIAGLALVSASGALAAEAAHTTVVDANGNPAGQETPVSVLTNLLFWELVSFVLLFVALSIVVFPKMFGALKNRQKHIEDALAKASRVNEEAEALFAKHEKMLAESHAEAKRITDDAMSKGEKAREEMINAAKADAANVVKHAKAEIRRAQDAAMESIRSQAVELSLLASSSVLERSLSDDDHRRLATQAVDNAVAAFSKN